VNLQHAARVGFQPARAVVFLLVVAGFAACGSDDAGDAVTTAEPEPAAITSEQLSQVPLGTRRARVERVLGPPYRKQDTKPSGVAQQCYRYRGIAGGGVLDPVNEYRLCYDRRDRLSVKSTAPIE
jgi:hypothetical protein